MLPQNPAQFNNKSTMNTFESFLVRFLEIFPNKKVRVKNVVSLWEGFWTAIFDKILAAFNIERIGGEIKKAQ